MNNWIKYWVPSIAIVSIILSITALVRCEPITLTDSWLAWAIGISVSMVSLGMVIVLGYQIYNSATLDKRMQDMFDEKTKEVRDDIAASAARSDSGVLYQVNALGLKFYFATKNYKEMLNTLENMSNDAVIMNKQEYLSDVAKLIIRAYILIQRDAPSFLLQNSVLDQIRTVASSVQTHLLSSDAYARPLIELIDNLADSQKDLQKECSHDGEKKEV